MSGVHPQPTCRCVELRAVREGGHRGRAVALPDGDRHRRRQRQLHTRRQRDERARQRHAGDARVRGRGQPRRRPRRHALHRDDRPERLLGLLQLLQHDHVERHRRGLHARPQRQARTRRDRRRGLRDRVRADGLHRPLREPGDRHRLRRRIDGHRHARHRRLRPRDVRAGADLASGHHVHAAAGPPDVDHVLGPPARGPVRRPRLRRARPGGGRGHVAPLRPRPDELPAPHECRGRLPPAQRRRRRRGGLGPVHDPGPRRAGGRGGRRERGHHPVRPQRAHRDAGLGQHARPLGADEPRCQREPLRRRHVLRRPVRGRRRRRGRGRLRPLRPSRRRAVRLLWHDALGLPRLPRSARDRVRLLRARHGLGGQRGGAQGRGRGDHRHRRGRDHGERAGRAVAGGAVPEPDARAGRGPGGRARAGSGARGRLRRAGPRGGRRPRGPSRRRAGTRSGGMAARSRPGCTWSGPRPAAAP